VDALKGFRNITRFLEWLIITRVAAFAFALLDRVVFDAVRGVAFWLGGSKIAVVVVCVGILAPELVVKDGCGWGGGSVFARFVDGALRHCGHITAAKLMCGARI